MMILRRFSRLSRQVAQPGTGKTVIARRGPRLAPKISNLDTGPYQRLQGVDATVRKRHANMLEKVARFDQLRINQKLRHNATTQLHYEHPTAVQKLAIKSIAASDRRRDASGSEDRTRHWLIAAETGSGKTMAYLVPFMNRLCDAATNDGSGPFLKTLILVPTSELVEQVASFTERLARDCGIKVMRFTGRNSQLSSGLVSGIHVAVATPDKLLNFCKNHAVLAERALAAVDSVIVDEADSLLNSSWQASTKQVLATCKEKSDVVFVTATIPRAFDKVLRAEYPDLVRLVTPSIHCLPRHIDLRVVEIWRRPYNNNRMSVLERVLWAIYNDNTEPDRVKRVVIFANFKSDVPKIVGHLRAAGYPRVCGVTGEQAPKERAELLAEFVNEPQIRGDLPPVSVLVTTDLAARGIDMNRVRNVLMYDVPPTPADLLHRAGRTGRLGASGRVFLLTSRKEPRWVQGLRSIVNKGMALA